MTGNPDSIEPIVAAARRALRAWKRQRAVTGALGGLVLGLTALAMHALWLEATTTSGLQTEHLPTLSVWLLLGVGGALGGWLRPLPVTEAAHELDLRAGLDDRLGTALEFAQDPSAMARLQRVDAASVADVAAGPLFPLPWRRGGPLLLAALLFALIGVGAALTFDLAPAPPAPVAEPATPADDLLEAIQLEKERLIERGDKAGVRLLDDMAKEVRRIQVRREELKRRIAERRASEPPAPASEPEELELPPPPAGPREDKPRGDLITAEDLEQLEADMVQGMTMSEAQLGDLTSKMFASTRAAKKLNEEFHHHIEHEMDATIEAENPSLYGAGESAAGQTQDRLSSMDSMGTGGAQSDRLTDVGDVQSQGNDMITRDLSAESQAAHDAAHDQQHSFNEFLKDFVKDMQSTVAEAAMGKKAKKRGKEVQVKGPQAMADKRDAQAEAGFEEMGDMKRSSGDAPPEEPMGGETGAGSGEGSDGPPPDDLSNLKSSEGSPGEDAIAIKSDSGGGQTSAGASGAGSGDPNAGGGRSGHLAGLSKLGGPLDEVLGALGEGSLPADERRQLFDRLARHKVQAGLASEADDVLLDYFAQAEELIADEEQLSPLFRDYATLYFDSIRPGQRSRTRASGPDDEPPRPSPDPAGPDARPVP